MHFLLSLEPLRSYRTQVRTDTLPDLLLTNAPRYNLLSYPRLVAAPAKSRLISSELLPRGLPTDSSPRNQIIAAVSRGIVYHHQSYQLSVEVE